MRHRIEYLPVWIVVKLFGLMPRPLARACGIFLGQLVYFFMVVFGVLAFAICRWRFRRCRYASGAA